MSENIQKNLYIFRKNRQFIDIFFDKGYVEVCIISCLIFLCDH